MDIKDQRTLPGLLFRFTYDFYFGMILGLLEGLVFNFIPYIILFVYFPEYLSIGVYIAFFQSIVVASNRIGFSNKSSRSCSKWPNFKNVKGFIVDWVNMAKDDGIINLQVWYVTMFMIPIITLSALNIQLNVYTTIIVAYLVIILYDTYESPYFDFFWNRESSKE